MFGANRRNFGAIAKCKKLAVWLNGSGGGMHPPPKLTAFCARGVHYRSARAPRARMFTTVRRALRTRGCSLPFGARSARAVFATVRRALRARGFHYGSACALRARCSLPFGARFTRAGKNRRSLQFGARFARAGRIDVTTVRRASRAREESIVTTVRCAFVRGYLA